MLNCIQTLWTSDKSLIKDSFGWASPQSHLMAWALSSLLLKKQFRELRLYTDHNGARILIDRLQLPYTDVITNYDNLSCPSSHWGIAKILTYADQKEPFIHIDGDIFINNKIRPQILKGRLIAQNEERGTAYYRNMMCKLTVDGRTLPNFLSEELEKNSIGSYNLGIMGGNDIDFIHRYATTAIRIIRANHWGDPLFAHPSINYNLLFEQVLFYALVKHEGATVETFFPGKLNDNGYTYNDFSDFYKLPSSPLLHLLGGFKRKEHTCKLMEQTLLYLYPEYYERVIKNFADKDIKLPSKDEYNTGDLNAQTYFAQYIEFIKGKIVEWRSIESAELLNLERLSTVFIDFHQAVIGEKLMYRFKLNPYLSIFHIPEEWPQTAKSLLNAKLSNRYNKDGTDILLIPKIEGKGYMEILINDLEYDIIYLLRSPRTFKNLMERLKPCFKNGQGVDTHKYTSLIASVTEKLLMQNAIIPV